MGIKFETKAQVKDALLAAKKELDRLARENARLKEENEELTTQLAGYQEASKGHAKRANEAEQKLEERDAVIGQRDALIEYTRQRYNYTVSQLADACRVIYETENQCFDLRQRLRGYSEESSEAIAGSAKLAELEKTLSRAYDDRSRYEEVATEMLVQITGIEPTLEGLVNNVAVDVTASHKIQSSRGQDYGKEGYTLETIAKRDRTYDSNNGRVVVFNNNKAILLPSVPGVLSKLEGKGFVESREGTPYSNGEYPVDDFDMQARLRVMSRYNHVVHEYDRVKDAKQKNAEKHGTHRISKQSEELFGLE